jgi:hypothetical protein
MNPSSLSHISYTKELKILDEKANYNGRVQIMEPPAETLFNMQERINVKNKETNYRAPIHEESSLLKTTFFSAENIQILQNGIKAGVYKKSNEEILVPNQNIDTLKIIMYSIYGDHAENKRDNIKGQIQDLNKLVLDYAINNVYNEAIAYKHYLRDQSTLAMPFERSLQNDRDYKHLEHKDFM